MKSSYRVMISVLAAVAMALAIVYNQSDADNAEIGDDGMAMKCMKNANYQDLGIAPFPSDIEAVERAWSEPIPEDLLLVGGVDGFGWARICRDENDPPGIFHGEYRDHSQLYQGLFRYRHPDGAPMPEEIFQNYYISHYSPGEGVEVVSYFPDRTPVNYFFLEPVNPRRILSPVR